MRFLAACLGATFASLALHTPAALAADRAHVVAIIDREPSTLDPVVSENAPSTEPMFYNVQDKLTDLSNDGRVVPGIATWDVKDGGKIVEFHLRPGIKFQSGDPLVADDVLFSHARGMAGSANYRGKFRGVNRLEKIDDHTVRFVFDRPNSGLLYNSSLFIGSKAYFDRVGEKEYVAHPVGTGPYRLTDYKLGQYYTLESWDGYWGAKKPSVEKIVVRLVKDETTRVSMMKAGEADFLVSVPYKDVQSLQKAGFNMAYADTFPTMSLTMQTYNQKVPWFKAEVRRAMAHAIDANAIIKGLFGGIPKRYAMFEAGEVGFDPDLKPYAYDPALAKKLLAQAGYPNGFSMPMSITTAYYGQKDTAEAVVLYLKAVGINVKAQVVDSVTDNAQLREHGKDPNFEFTLLRATTISNAGDPANALFFSLEAAAPTSIYKSANPEFDTLLQQAVGEYDNDKRAELVKKAARILYDEAGIIPIWNAVTVYGMTAGLEFTPTQHQRPLMRFVDLTRTKK